MHLRLSLSRRSPGCCRVHPKSETGGGRPGSPAWTVGPPQRQLRADEAGCTVCHVHGQPQQAHSPRSPTPSQSAAEAGLLNVAQGRLRREERGLLP